MGQFRVRYSPQTISDLNGSYEWAIGKWGLERAQKWLDEVEFSVGRSLSLFPTAHPIAPESKEFDIEIRQMIFGRYRVLFTIDGMTVKVLRIRGPFTGANPEISDDED